MLFITGAGYAYPSGSVDRETLESLQLGIDLALIEQRSGITSRRTTLPVDFIRSTRNASLPQSFATAVETPTELGFRASTMAMDNARVSLDDIGLVIGESITPEETTPSSAQRIAGKLGLKIPAFDITANSLSAYLSILGSWKEDRLPQHTIITVADAPTQRVDYSVGEEAAYFGDGAFALVVSKNSAPGLRVVNSLFRVDTSDQLESPIRVDTLGNVKRHTLNRQRTEEQFQRIIDTLVPDRQLLAQDVAIVWALDDRELQGHILSSIGLFQAKVYSTLDTRGNLVGAGTGCAVAEHWNALNTHRFTLLVDADGGPSWGGVLLERVSA